MRRDWIGKSFALVLCAAVQSGCDQGKSSASVFPENSGLGKTFCSADRVIPNRFLVTWEDGRITRESGADAETFVRDFVEPRLKQIRYVEHDKLVSTPVFPSRVALNGQKISPDCPSRAYGYRGDWHSTITQTQEAWSAGYRGKGVTVAVVDTGVDYDHPKLKPNLEVNKVELNGVAGQDDDMNGYIDDIYGFDVLNRKGSSYPEDHGSHVAGIIAASDQVQLGTGHEPIGVAPDAKLLGVKFLGDGPDSGTISKAIEAIEYARARGARIINASWGGDHCSTTLNDVIGKYKNEMLFVTAAGNDGRDLDRFPSFPASFMNENQITVAASQSNDIMAGFSNSSYKYVHIGAPGTSILSTIPFFPSRPVFDTLPGNQVGYDCFSGTSMATPVVSGAAAILWSAEPNASVVQIRESLIESADPRNYRVQSTGRLNVFRALEVLRRKLQ